MAKNKGTAVNIIEGIIIGILILIIAAMLFLYFTFSKTGAAPEIFGNTIYHTMAVNMEPEIPADTAVIAKASEIENIKVGSAVLCSIGEDTVLTRVVQILSENGELSYVVKFDTAPANDTFKIPAENIIAKAVWQSSLLGGLLSFATSTFGIMLVIIIPSFIIIVFQVIRIISVKSKEERSEEYQELESVTEDEDNRFADDVPPLRPLEFRTEDEPEPKKPAVLSIDRNGKGGLTAPDEGDRLPLYTYDRSTVKNENTVKSGESVVKPVSTPNTDNFYSSYVSVSDRDPLYGDRIKRQEIVEDDAENEKLTFTEQQEKAKQPESSSPFMSNVIPEKLAKTVEFAERAASNPVQAPTAPTAKITNEKAAASDPTIPPQAVIPKETLAPPVKHSNSKAISDLMSMIDAEESKLRK